MMMSRNTFYQRTLVAILGGDSGRRFSCHSCPPSQSLQPHPPTPHHPFISPYTGSLILQFHSWDIPLLGAYPCPPRSFILFSLDIFIVPLQPTCQSPSSYHTSNPLCGILPLCAGLIPIAFPHMLLILISYFISIPICHSLTCRHISTR
jgi:hypothetical protein